MLRTSRIPGRTILTREHFRELVRPLTGMPMSHTWRGAGSAIFLELGALTTTKRMVRGTGQVTSSWGEVTLMLEWSWRVESPRYPVRQLDHGDDAPCELIG